jgi:2-amino-4-hydroxy-6-hydroxymethyldihydropteridine diphosphokinase
MKKVFLGIGTNLGDRETNLKNAIEKIAENIGPILKSSSVYETDPWGFTSDNLFFNMVVEVKTRLTPAGVLGAILQIEVLLGRTRSEKKYSSRVIDIDILLYENYVIDEVSLRIPHPLIHERKFVLVPLCEIAPEFIHPVLGKSIRVLLEECTDQSNPLSAKL